MHLPTTRLSQAALAAMIVGAGLIVAFVLAMWLGGPSDATALDQDDLTGSQGLTPYETGLVDTKGPSKGRTKDGIDSLIGGKDPFANSSGDNQLHKVEIRFTSDGALYAGWRYRTKGGEGVKVSQRTLMVRKDVRGGLPVAQAAVQVMQTASYATCSIVIDGVAVTTQTAKGVNHVTVCVG